MTHDECKSAIKNIDFQKELDIEILNLNWGHNKNLVINCKDVKTEIEFFFCVFWDKQYQTEKFDFNFKKYKENDFEQNKIIKAQFKILKSGFVRCVSAKLT